MVENNCSASFVSSQANFTFHISLDGNVTSSELQIAPKYYDNGKNLTCTAKNTKLVNNRRSAKEFNINLNVLCELF